MADKPKLTILKALKEFPNECEAVLPDDRMAAFEAMTQDISIIVTPNIRQTLRNELLAAVMEWLEGKKLPIRRGGVAPNGDHWLTMPGDPLRYFLEEVREQRKQKGKQWPQ